MIQTNSMQNSFQSFETPAVTDPVRVHDSALACLSAVMMLDCTAGHFSMVSEKNKVQTVVFSQNMYYETIYNGFK